MTSPKILYIAGWGRSGSTLLDQVLGEGEGWFSCGELRLLTMNLACGCGAPVLECELWGQVLRETLRRHSLRDLDAVADLRQRSVGTNVRTLAALGRGRRPPRRSVLPTHLYAAFLSDLYATVARATGARVLVDSSKMVAEPYLLRALTDVDLHVVHLVRDPRASAYSWSRRKPSFSPHVYLPTRGPLSSSFNWLRRNLAVEVAVRPRQPDRYLRIRYEDFADRPQVVAESICSLVGEPAAQLPFCSESAIRLSPNHMVAGNPVRLLHGEVAIRADDDWRTNMDARSRALATLPALPLMSRYGYQLD